MSIKLPITSPADPYWSTPIGWVGVGEDRQPIYPIGGGSSDYEDDADDDDEPLTEAELLKKYSGLRGAHGDFSAQVPIPKPHWDKVEPAPESASDDRWTPKPLDITPERQAQLMKRYPGLWKAPAPR